MINLVWIASSFASTPKKSKSDIYTKTKIELCPSIKGLAYRQIHPNKISILELEEELSKSQNILLQAIPQRLRTEPRFLASSFSSWHQMVYRPANVFDNNFKSAWVEGKKGDGINEWLSASFRFPDPTQVYGAIILPGFAKNQFMFKRNNRPLLIKMELLCENIKTPIQCDMDLEDKRVFQVFRFPTQLQIPVQGSCLITITIIKVFRGTHYLDTSIAEAALLFLKPSILSKI